MSENMRPDNIILRIERLERQNRRLKQGAWACILALASLFFVSHGLMGQTQRKSQTPRAAAPKAPAPPAPPPALVLPKDIEAESFTLKDASGRVRAELAMAGGGPTLKLRDQDGTALVTISLLDSASGGGPLLLLSEPQHRASLSMSVMAGQGSQLSLIGERADVQAHIGVTPDGTSLELSDKDGSTTTIGNGVQPTRGGQVKKTSAASIALFSKDRKVLWSAP